VDQALVRRNLNGFLAHQRVEWGMDCCLLASAEHAWLWNLKLNSEGLAALWHRALMHSHHLDIPRVRIRDSLHSEL
jgi:hypothetical protein